MGKGRKNYGYSDIGRASSVPTVRDSSHHGESTFKGSVEMSELSPEDPKARFRAALEKKKQSSARSSESRIEKKVQGSQTSGNSPKMFRRKSGSA
jgi:hypothetical protein